MTHSIQYFQSSAYAGATRKKQESASPTPENGADKPEKSRGVNEQASVQIKGSELLSLSSAVAPNVEAEIKLSAEAKRSFDMDATFDKQKINDIKSAIREGNYPLDARKIAESFLLLEKMIAE